MKEQQTMKEQQHYTFYCFKPAMYQTIIIAESEEEARAKLKQENRERLDVDHDEPHADDEMPLSYEGWCGVLGYDESYDPNSEPEEWDLFSVESYDPNSEGWELVSTVYS